MLPIPITSPLITCPHGFFTRRGGVSGGVYADLNCGYGSSDDLTHVIVNRARAVAALGLPAGNLLSLHQVHSNRALIVDQAYIQRYCGTWGEVRTTRPKGDALVTNCRNVALAVVTADCAPIFLYDLSAKVIAVVHAGWRGALSGVIAATVRAMQDLNAVPARIQAVIGPTISAQKYQVGQDLYQQFIANDSAFDCFFTIDNVGGNKKPTHYLFDLVGFCCHRLQTAGVKHSARIERCTYSEADMFYSYRRAQHTSKDSAYGRLMSIIRL